MPSGRESFQPLGETPPILQGHADFSNVWKSLDEEFGAAVAPDLPDGFAEAFAARSFHGFADVDGFFRQKIDAPFVAWFNASVVGRNAWAGKQLSGPDVDAHFQTYWDSYARISSVTLTEFGA